MDVPLLRLSHTATLSPFEVRTLYLTKEGVKPAPSMLDL
ncbi:unknown [Clostridium sp. CAG:448]|nr:unknown [Clostridium sp. CAG:448]